MAHELAGCASSMWLLAPYFVMMSRLLQVEAWQCQQLCLCHMTCHRIKFVLNLKL